MASNSYLPNSSSSPSTSSVIATAAAGPNISISSSASSSSSSAAPTYLVHPFNRRGFHPSQIHNDPTGLAIFQYGNPVNPPRPLSTNTAHANPPLSTFSSSSSESASSISAINDNEEVIWLEADEDPDADTEEVHAAVIDDQPARRGAKRKREESSQSEYTDDGEMEQGSDTSSDNYSDGDSDTSKSSVVPRKTKRQRPTTGGKDVALLLRMTSPPRHPTARKGPAGKGLAVGAVAAAPARNTTGGKGIVVSSAPPSQIIAPPAQTGGKSIAAQSTVRSRGTWSHQEEQAAIRHMGHIMRHAATNGIKGEDRFREAARRMQREGLNREWGGLRNMWNRKLREMSGLDERRKRKNPLATSKQDKATKAQRKKRKLAREAREREEREQEEEEEEEEEEEGDTEMWGYHSEDGKSDDMEEDGEDDVQGGCEVAV